jgi:hypothetical protein
MPSFNAPITFPVLQNTSTPAFVDAAYALTSGNNTLAPPTGTSWILLYSPNTGVTFTFKGANGDTGYPTAGCFCLQEVASNGTGLVVSVSSNTTAFLAYI